MNKRLFLLGAILAGVVIGFVIQPLISADSILPLVKRFDYVLNTAVRNYVDEVDTQKLFEAAIKGMLNELDVHSVYISADEMKRVNEEFQGSFEGIGVEFDIVSDTITIVSPIPGGPSELLGIQPGDKIVKIDGKVEIGIDRNDVPKKLKGPKGTIVEVDIKRDGVKDLIHFSITRNQIPLNTVDASYMIDGTDIGVVVVNRFAATTHSEVVEALDNLRNQGMKKVIIDLRGNPGGYLNQAVELADEFLPQGDTIVFTQSRVKQFDEVHIASSGQRYEKTPLIVLVNAGSASASEIVSGAIQDHDRGLIIGETSYGKGLVQRQYDVGDGSTFRLTISKYYTPSGRCIQRPYKDKDKYRHLAGRLELEEGSYIDNALDKITEQIKKINDKENAKENEKERNLINLDSLPIFHTERGRAVLASGGITPDYIVKADTLNQFSAQIRRKSIFYPFVDEYLRSAKGIAMKSKYEKNYTDFLRNFTVSDGMLEDFQRLAVSKGITWEADQFKQDKDYFKIALKAYIARSLWDRNKMMQVFSSIDNQLEKALQLFPEASKISKLK